MTNEQTVTETEARIAKLKEEYSDYLRQIIQLHKCDNSSPTLEELLECQKLSSKYFDYVENFVGQSDLLGAHKNGSWITGFAETCYSVLEVVVENYLFLKKNEAIFNGHLQPPSIHAYSNMQRMVKEYLDKNRCLTIQQEFEKYGLPITGFNFRKIPDVSKQGSWKLIVGIVISVLFMLIIMLFAYHEPHPSNFQILIYRGIFALAAALLAGIIPGFLSIESRWKSLKMRATGAIAIFIIIWLLNPPSLMD